MLTTDSIAFAYDSLPVLTDVSLTVSKGQCLGILGPNGSGKSTLCKLLAGLLTPQAGAIALDGRQLAAIPRAERARAIAYVPQQTEVSFPLTVREVVSLGRMPHTDGLGWERSADLAAVAAALDAMDATHLAGRLVQTLSGGERQRVFIARALAQEPALLILDEPTTHLDLRHQQACWQLLARLRRERPLTVIAAMHDLNCAADYCDMICLLNNGNLCALGPPAEILTAEQMRAVFETTIVVGTHPVTGRPLYVPAI
ncbi:MAG: ABC transporter ATP-binding protein [Deltaproteobacteria bacterium]|nr:ABC transporter ATP-binding protein [Deltaproteobacteria bacterium]